MAAATSTATRSCLACSTWCARCPLPAVAEEKIQTEAVLSAQEKEASEYTDLSDQHPALRSQIWAVLNRTNLELYMHHNLVSPSAPPPPGFLLLKVLRSLCVAHCVWPTRVDQLRRQRLLEGCPRAVAGRADWPMQPGMRRQVLDKLW